MFSLHSSMVWCTSHMLTDICVLWVFISEKYLGSSLSIGPVVNAMDVPHP